MVCFRSFAGLASATTVLAPGPARLVPITQRTVSRSRACQLMPSVAIAAPGVSICQIYHVAIFGGQVDEVSLSLTRLRLVLVDNAFYLLGIHHQQFIKRLDPTYSFAPLNGPVGSTDSGRARKTARSLYIVEVGEVGGHDEHLLVRLDKASDQSAQDHEPIREFGGAGVVDVLKARAQSARQCRLKIPPSEEPCPHDRYLAPQRTPFGAGLLRQASGPILLRSRQVVQRVFSIAPHTPLYVSVDDFLPDLLLIRYPPLLKYFFGARLFSHPDPLTSS